MLAGNTYIECHTQVAGIVCRNTCTTCGLQTPRSKGDTPPKIFQNDHGKILQDFRYTLKKQWMANQTDIVVVDKEEKMAVVTDVADPNEHH